MNRTERAFSSFPGFISMGVFFAVAAAVIGPQRTVDAVKNVIEKVPQAISMTLDQVRTASDGIRYNP